MSHPLQSHPPPDLHLCSIGVGHEFSASGKPWFPVGTITFISRLQSLLFFMYSKLSLLEEEESRITIAAISSPGCNSVAGQGSDDDDALFSECFEKLRVNPLLKLFCL
ncbi:hypothetical protein YC2023_114566 [Brassica napus]